MATQHLKLHPLTGSSDHDVTGLASGQIIYVQNPSNGVQSTGLYTDGSGGLTATTASITTLSAATMISGSTNLYNIFSTAGSGVQAVQPGSNITTGGTLGLPVVNLTASPSVNNITFSGTAIGGNVQAAAVTATSLSAGTLSGGTILSGATNLYSIFATAGSGVQAVQPGSNITTGGTLGLPVINLVASPSVNNLTVSGTANVTGALQSGSTDLNNIYVQGSGTNGTIPLWTATRTQGNSIITQASTGVTVAGSVNILGDVFVLGTAATFNTQTIQALDNNITLNYSGSYVSAYGGGITVLSGNANGSSSSWTIDANGAWSANTAILTSAITVNGGAIASTGGGTITSGGTNLYSIFATAGSGVQSVGANGNLSTGGTATNPVISLAASPSFNNVTFSGTAIGGTVQAGAGTFTSLSAGTLSGGTITSGSTNLYSIFARPELVVNNVNAGSNITTGGTAISPTINLAASPSVNNITFSGTAIGGNVQAAAVTATSLSGATISGGTLYSGSTNLYSIFLTAANVSASTVSAGSNIAVVNAGLDYNVSVVGSPSFNNLTVSGTGNFTGTLQSGGTNLYSIFQGIGTDTDHTAVQNGLNTYTGGTQSAPTVNISAATLTYLSATTISGGTIYSGSTNLYQIFATTGATVAYWSSSTGSNSIIASNGSGNLATGAFSIVGGQSNSATTTSAFIGGGSKNETRQNFATVVGGYGNIASGLRSFIGNGDYNLATQNKSAVVTGYRNSGTSTGAIVVGGQYNLASGNASFVANGYRNTAAGNYSFIGSGLRNSATTTNRLYATILNGQNNLATGDYSVIVNGIGNQATALHTFVGSGQYSSATTRHSAVVTGRNNLAGGSGTKYSTVVNGYINTASGLYATVVNGKVNTASGAYSTVINGSGNTSSGIASLVAGSGNTVSGARSAVIGGFGINGSANDTVYTPNARLAETTGSIIYSAGTPLQNIFAVAGSGVQAVQPGSNITTGGTLALPVINLAASPSVNGLSVSGTGNFTGTLQSGGTNLNDIYVQGNGTLNTLPLWTGTRLIGSSLITQGSTGVTVNGSVNILGDVFVLGTATTFNTQTVQSLDNNITLNYSGSYVSAYGGGITVLSGNANGTSSTWTIDANGSWSSNTAILTSAITVNGGNIAVTGGGAMTSGGTNLYNIFATSGQDLTTASNGLTKSNYNVTLGGTLTAATAVVLGGNALQLSGEGASSAIVAWSGAPYYTRLSVNGSGSQLKTTFGTFGDNYFLASDTTTMNYTDGGTGTSMRMRFDGTNMYVTDAVNSRGLEYLQDYSPQFQTNSLVTKLYVDNAITGVTSGLTNTQVQPGSNITTGGTASLPVVSLVASPSVNNLTVSGSTTAQGISGTTIYASQFFQMTPYTGANPTSPNNNDMWMYSAATGIITLNYRIGGVTKVVELS